MGETIFALSSGAPPAAIGIVRISGPRAGETGKRLGGSLPEPRLAAIRKLRAADGSPLDEALVLWFPGPATATGEDLLELHCHGGRAVIRAVERALETECGCRPAEPGEFTRRAFANGRIDLAEAEGLGDLLTAETELQRQIALRSADGSLSDQVEAWREAVLLAAAQIEAALDFDDEDDVAGIDPLVFGEIARLRAAMGEWLDRPLAEKLARGVRVALAGPPNAGKSSLINALCEDEVAIATPLAGTTRDVIERGVAWNGVPFVLVDMAGLREETEDPIEAIGIARARQAMENADIVLWLGPEGEGPHAAWEVQTMADLRNRSAKPSAPHRVSAVTGAGLDALKASLVETARDLLPKPDAISLNARQHRALLPAEEALAEIREGADPLLVAESLRVARRAFDSFTGHAATEDVLDRLFSRFCIGK